MAFVEYMFREKSHFPENGGYYVFLNERTTRTGAQQCLCKEDSSTDYPFEITLPDGS